MLRFHWVYRVRIAGWATLVMYGLVCGLPCRSIRAAAARWAKARRLALAVNGTIGAVGVGLVVGSGLPAALCLTPWDWPLTLAGAVLAGAACVVECALTDRYTRP